MHRSLKEQIINCSHLNNLVQVKRIFVYSADDAQSWNCIRIETKQERVMTLYTTGRNHVGVQLETDCHG